MSQPEILFCLREGVFPECLATAEDQEMIQYCGGLACADCLATENARLKYENELLSEQAMHDPLTGLLNRRALGDRLETIIENGMAGAGVGDVKNFRHVNNLLGHAAGDALLRKIADGLQSSVRLEDAFVARQGGDEFAIVADLTPRHDSKMLAMERMLRVYQRCKQWFDNDPQIIQYNSQVPDEIKLGFRMGLAVWDPEKMSDAKELLDNADAKGSFGTDLEIIKPDGVPKGETDAETEFAAALQKLPGSPKLKQLFQDLKS